MDNFRKIKEISHEYQILVISFFVSIFLLFFVDYKIAWLYEIISESTYLAWHNLFEFTAVIIALSIFIVSYYTYKESGNLRLIIVGNMFLAIGFLDLFHMLTFSGMPDFFGVNDQSNRAITFWIISRLIFAAGLLVGIFASPERKSNIKRFLFSLPILFLVFIILFIVSFAPNYIPTMNIEGLGITPIKKVLEYIIIIIFILVMALYIREYRKSKDRHSMLYATAILFGVLGEISFAQYANVYDVHNFLGHIFKIISYFIIFQVIYAKNIVIPYRDCEEARNRLNEYVENLDTLVQLRTNELQDVNEELLQDLNYAKELQRTLMPAKMPEEKNVGFYSQYFPAERLSGDFYNVFKINEDHIGLYIGDVAGHGIAAAMLTLFINHNIRSLENSDENTEIVSPAVILEDLYKVFNTADFKDETYFVMLYGIYNIKTKEFVYASGGINVEPILIKSSGDLQLLDVKGFAICRLGDLLAPNFLDRTIQLEAGDKILFYTDGLVDIEDKLGEKYSCEKLGSFLKEYHSLTGGNLGVKIMDHVFRFVEYSNKIKDDITFVLMEIR